LRNTFSGSIPAPAKAALGAPEGWPKTNQALIDLLAHRLGRAPAGHETGARLVLIPGVRAADDLDVGILLTARQRAFDLRAAAGKLVRVADAVARLAKLAGPFGCLVGCDRTGLTVHLDRALTSILERDGELVLLDAAQHDHVPRPVEEHGLQVFAPFRGRVFLRRRTAELRVHRDRQQGREAGGERDTG
jgi:hypothetical protein